MVQGAYGFVVFLTSAAALVLEIVAGRLIAPYVGMSLYTWTAIIAVVLAGLSVGHWIGGRLAPNTLGRKEGEKRVAWALGLAAVSSLASLVLIRLVAAALLTAGLHPVGVIVALTGALFFLPSLFVGIVSPVLTKLAVDARPDETGRVIGRMFALGAAGSIMGTLLAGYLFISWIGSQGTVLSVAALYALLGAGFAWTTRFLAIWAAVALIPAAGLGLGGATVFAFASPCEVESDYFCIRTDDFSAESLRESRLMALDHLVHSINDREDPGLIYSPYVHFVDETAARRLPRPGPIRAFFVGGGGYTLPRAWAHAYPGSELTVAELDPAVTAVATTRMWLDPHAPGLEILHQDARLALQALPPAPTFDVVFGDAFHDIAVPPHLVTREFHKEIARRLSERGFYAVNVVDLGSAPKFLYAVVKTLKLDFESVEVWNATDEVDLSGRVTYIVLASAYASPGNRLRNSYGLAHTWARWSDARLSRRIEKAGVPVLTDDFAPVDRLMAGILLAGD